MTKIGSGHLSGEEYFGPVDATYAEFMASSLRAQRREKNTNTAQSPSTIANMKAQAERHPSEDKEWMIRPIGDCLAVPDAKNRDELVGRRIISHEDAMLHRSTRTGKNTLGDGFKQSTSPERRDSAIEAFTFSKPYNPTDEELKRFNRLCHIKAETPIPEIKKDPPKRGFVEWLHWMFWRDWL